MPATHELRDGARVAVTLVLANIVTEARIRSVLVHQQIIVRRGLSRDETARLMIPALLQLLRLLRPIPVGRESRRSRL